MRLRGRSRLRPDRQGRAGRIAGALDGLRPAAYVPRLTRTLQEGPQMATVPVTDATFEAEVRKSDIPVVVDFWAEWCGPCKTIGPALEEISSEMEGKVKIVKVNVDENPSTPASMGV